MEEGLTIFRAENITIYDGQFTTYNQTTHVHQYEDQPNSFSGRHEAGAGINGVKYHIAPRAFATQQEGEAPKCHPNTRMAILSQIMSWIADRPTLILWIFGAAGAGKSAIARSIVERCLNRGDITIVRFFFFRADGTRNTLDRVVATLVYQLIQSLPELDAIIFATLRSHPRIFDDSLETQLRMLILEPLHYLHSLSPITKTFVILFDGVDECTDRKKQPMLIKTLHQIFSSTVVPVALLFFSRPEFEIRAEFQSRKMDSVTKHLELDHGYTTDKDIELFLVDSFRDIKENHPFRRLIPQDWPNPWSIRKIVKKSSGHFIFASVAVNYISSGRFNPVTMLEIILGIQPPGRLTPFAQLDALYRHIFSQVTNIDYVLRILATFILQDRQNKLEYCADIHEMPVDEIEIALEDLTSVVRCEEGKIKFLHASLADFLFDEDRSGPFYIDRILWSTWLSLICLGQPDWVIAAPLRQSKWSINDFITAAEPCEELRQAVLHGWYDVCGHHASDAAYYLTKLEEIDFDDGGETYLRMCDNFTRKVTPWERNYFGQ